jgi:hypothetical protein
MVPAARTWRWKTQESGGRFMTRAEACEPPMSSATAAANETIFNTKRIRMMNPILTEALIFHNRRT